MKLKNFGMKEDLLDGLSTEEIQLMYSYKKLLILERNVQDKEKIIEFDKERLKRECDCYFDI